MSIPSGVQLESACFMVSFAETNRGGVPLAIYHLKLSNKPSSKIYTTRPLQSARGIRKCATLHYTRSSLFQGEHFSKTLKLNRQDESYQLRLALLFLGWVA